MSVASKAFCVLSKGSLRQLKSSVTVYADNNSCSGVALWDTGATACCISKELAQSLGLKPKGYTFVHTPAGISKMRRFLVNIELPDNVIFQDVVVTESEIGSQKIDVLIGMNIISSGDFAISNEGGKTSFTFRIPPQERINFVKTERKRNLIGKPHGKGKRKESK